MKINKWAIAAGLLVAGFVAFKGRSMEGVSPSGQRWLVQKTGSALGSKDPGTYTVYFIMSEKGMGPWPGGGPNSGESAKVMGQVHFDTFDHAVTAAGLIP